MDVDRASYQGIYDWTCQSVCGQRCTQQQQQQQVLLHGFNPGRKRLLLTHVSPSGRLRENEAT